MSQRYGALSKRTLVRASKGTYPRRTSHPETANKGCDLVLDCVGGEVFDNSLDAVAPGGQIATIVEGKSALVHQKLFPKGASAHFIFVGVPSIHNIHPERQGQTLAQVAALVDAGKLRPHISRVLQLEEASIGHRLQEAGHVTGKLILQVFPT